MTQRFWRSGYVYFVQAEGNGLIKIGYSDRDVAKRFAMLQAASPVPLVLLGVMWGGLEIERRMHARFAALRDHGEWFRPGDRLVYMIRRWARPWSDDLSVRELRPHTLEEARQRILHLQAAGVDLQQPTRLRWFGPDRT